MKTMMPLSLRSQFNEIRDGFPSARFKSAAEAHNMEAALRSEQMSYKTCIVKRKRAPREFIVMLLTCSTSTTPPA